MMYGIIIGEDELTVMDIEWKRGSNFIPGILLPGTVLSRLFRPAIVVRQSHLGYSWLKLALKGLVAGARQGDQPPAG